MSKQLVLKIAGIVVPVVVALAGVFYGDIKPTIKSFCDAALSEDVRVQEVDAGAK